MVGEKQYYTIYHGNTCLGVFPGKRPMLFDNVTNQTYVSLDKEAAAELKKRFSRGEE